MFQKRCYGNISKITIQKSIFKGDNTVFSENDGCRKKFVKVQEEVALSLLNLATFSIVQG